MSGIELVITKHIGIMLDKTQPEQLRFSAACYLEDIRGSLPIVLRERIDYAFLSYPPSFYVGNIQTRNVYQMALEKSS